MKYKIMLGYNVENINALKYLFNYLSLPILSNLTASTMEVHLMYQACFPK